MANREIRIELLNRGIKQYALADFLGISETSFSKKLRKELPDEEKGRILEAIKELSKGAC